MPRFMSPCEFKMKLDLADDKLALIKANNAVKLCSPKDPQCYGILTRDGNMAFFNDSLEEVQPPNQFLLWLDDRPYISAMSTGIDFPIHVPRCKTISSGCYSNIITLPAVDIPDSVEEIGGSAFINCFALKEVWIPDSVKEMGSAVFKGCDSLEKISFPAMRRIEHLTCKKCFSLKEVEFRGPAVEIGADVFLECTSLESIEIPEGVRWIGQRAFYGCTSLKKVVLPSTLEIVDSHAFFGCTALEEIEIPAGIKYISEDVFAGCSSLKRVLFKGKSLNDVMALRHCPFGAHSFAIAGEKDIDFRVLDARSLARKRR